MPLFCSVLPPNRWSMAYGLYNTARTFWPAAWEYSLSACKRPRGESGYTLSATSALLFIALVVTAMTMFRYLTTDIQRQREVRQREREFLLPDLQKDSLSP